MRGNILSHVACLIAGLLAVGCGRGDVPRPRPIPVNQPILQKVRYFLEGYSRGQPVGSERQIFDSWVDQVRAEEPSAADLLGPGLREIAASPSEAKAVATRLLVNFPAIPPKKAAGKAPASP